MKYCSKCKKVYPDGIDCECLKENTQYSYKPAVMNAVDCEAICKCGSTENLKYHESYSWKHIGISDDPAYCRCAACQKKLDDCRDRENSMKYLIIDNYQDENKFCDSTDEVEEFLKYYVEDSDRDSGPINDVFILKLEPLEQRSLRESDFKPQGEYTSEGYRNKQEPNTHIVVWDGEIFRVEDVMVPELEYDGGREVKW